MRVYPLVGVAIILFSISPILVRYASDAPALSVAAWRTIFGALLLAPVAIVRSRDEVRSFSRKDWTLVVASGVFLSAHFICWIESIYFTTVSSASMLVASSPILLGILSYIFLKERLSALIWFTVLGGVVGAILLGIGDRAQTGQVVTNAGLGNWLAIAAAACFSAYFIIGRMMRQKISWLAYVGPVYLVVAICTVGFVLLRGGVLFGLTPKIYMLCFVMALGPQVIGHGSFNYAVKYLSATLLGLFGLLEPIGATFYAYFLFGEKPTTLSLAGIVVLLTSVAIVLVVSDRRGKRSKETRLPADR